MEMTCLQYENWYKKGWYLNLSSLSLPGNSTPQSGNETAEQHRLIAKIFHSAYLHKWLWKYSEYWFWGYKEMSAHSKFANMKSANIEDQNIGWKNVY